MTRISFLNGQFIDHDKAFVHIEDRGFQFADGVYEVIAFKNSRLVDSKPHLDRLFTGLEELSIKHDFLQDEIEKTALELLSRNNIDDGSVYLQVTRGVNKRVPWVPQGIKPTFVMTANPAKVFTKEEFEKGLSLMTHDDIRWGRVDIKTVALLASSMVNQKAKDSGYSDGLFVRDGVVTEASFANFFFVDKDGVLTTKGADNRILGGITRKRIIDLAQKDGIKVSERDFGVDEVLQGKEAFLSSSTLMVRPVVRVDAKVVGDGKVGDLTRRVDELYRGWL